MIFSTSWQKDALLLVLILGCVLYLYMKRNFNYWKKRGIVDIEPRVFVGNALDILLLRKPIALWLKDLYDLVPDEPYFGIFVLNQPHLILRSPEVIKQILAKDFKHFADRTMAAPDHNELLSNFMFFQKGPSWKTTRSKIAPSFSTGKVKSMFPIVSHVGENLKSFLEVHGNNIDAKDAAFKFSIDATVHILFGIKANCLRENNGEFENIAKRMFAFNFRNGLVQSSYSFNHDLVKWFKLDFFEKYCIDFFRDVFWRTFDSRKDVASNSHCLVDILRKIREQDPTFDGDKMVGQATMIFVASYETTGSTIAFTLYEMCLNQVLQDKVRDEIRSVIQEYNGLTYEGINEMKYLEMCILETLRKYPVIPFIERRCNDDCTISGTNTIIEKGTPVYVPLYGLHYDEKHFPDPEAYLPERYLENVNVEKLIHLPFGYGPRMCVGERLGMMNSKLAIIHILKNFVVERNSRTPVPIEYSSRTLILQSKVGLPMRFKPLSA